MITNLRKYLTDRLEMEEDLDLGEVKIMMEKKPTSRRK